MEYYVAFNKEELEAAMILNSKQSLGDIAVIEENHTIREELPAIMTKKEFFVEKDGKRKWNPFVQFVLENVFSADCIIRTTEPDGSKCHVFFRNDVMILLTKKADREEYVFYFVPYVPKVIGGFTCHYEELKNTMGICNGIKAESFIAEEEPESSEDLIKCIKSKGFRDAFEENVLLTISGEVFGKPAFFGVLFKAEDGCVFAQSEEKYIKAESVDYYDLVARITKWVVEIQGGCIRYGDRV